MRPDGATTSTSATASSPRAAAPRSSIPTGRLRASTSGRCCSPASAAKRSARSSAARVALQRRDPLQQRDERARRRRGGAAVPHVGAEREADPRQRLGADADQRALRERRPQRDQRVQLLDLRDALRDDPGVELAGEMADRVDDHQLRVVAVEAADERRVELDELRPHYRDLPQRRGAAADAVDRDRRAGLAQPAAASASAGSSTLRAERRQLDHEPVEPAGLLRARAGPARARASAGRCRS